MDCDKMIEHLRECGTYGFKQEECRDAALAIETLRAENAEMEKQLGEFSEFLCHMTGNLLSTTNYTAQAMISAAEDYQQRVCDSDCELRAENEKLRAYANDAYGTMYNMYGAGGKYCDEKILAFWRRWNGKKEDA